MTRWMVGVLMVLAVVAGSVTVAVVAWMVRSPEARPMPVVHVIDRLADRPNVPCGCVLPPPRN
jgi:hypothetical protein